MGGAELAWEERWLWLGVSLLLGLLISWWIWAMDRYAAEESWWADLLRAPWMPALWEGARWLYAFGLPAAVLLWRHALTERGLGLQPFAALDESLPAAARLANWNDWMADLGITAAIVAIVALLHTLGLRPIAAARSPRRPATMTALGEAVLHEVHWAFYREPFVLLLGAEMGSWAGLGLVALEAALNPLRWRDLHDAERRPLLLWRAELAVVSLLLFILTGNLPLMILAEPRQQCVGEGGRRRVALRHLASRPTASR